MSAESFTGADDELLPIAFNVAQGEDAKWKHWEQATITRAHFYELADPSFGGLNPSKVGAGGFVFGELQAAPSPSCACPGSKRRRRHRVRESVKSRSAITLDVDFPDRVEDFLDKVRSTSWSGIIYFSASATPEQPKYRLVLWVDRAMTPDEYWFVSKAVALRIGPAAFDPQTYQAERQMYLPSTKDEAAFFTETLAGEPVNVGEQLDTADMVGIPARGASAGTEDVVPGSWLSGLAGASAEPCARLQRALQKAEKSFKELDANPTALNTVNSLVHLAEEGHHGIVAAIATLGEMFQDSVTSGRSVLGIGEEYDRMLAGAVAIAAAVKTPEEFRACCLGVEEAFPVEVESDPFAVLTGHVTRGLGVRDKVKKWKTDSVDANHLAHEILSRRWTIKGDSGEETCKVLRNWAGTPYEWHKTHWEQVPHDHLDAEIKRLLEAAVTPKRNARTGEVVTDDNGKTVYVPAKINPNLLRNIARLMELESIVHARLGSGHWIDCTNGRCMVGEADRRYLSFTNGILDLENDVMFDHESAFFNTYAMRFPYDPAAGSPVWEKTLEQWFPEDQPSRDTLEEVMGYLLLGGMEHDKMFAFLGEPRSGKGTVMRVVDDMLGSAYAAQTLDEIGDRFGKEDLLGKRVVHVTEAVGGAGAKKVVSVMKAISGQDTGQTVKTKGGKSVQVDFECRFVLTGNENLELPDSSGVIADRIVALLFPESFLGREDYTLKDKLRAEYSGIFNRLRVAYARLIARGRFVQPESGRAIIDRIRRYAAPEKTWFAETFEVTGSPADIVEFRDAVAVFDMTYEGASFMGDRMKQRKIRELVENEGHGRAVVVKQYVDRDGKRVQATVITGVQVTPGEDEGEE